MTSSFGKPYAELYDAIYEKKDYGLESEFLKAVLSDALGHLPKTLLDFGCGTGRHSSLLHQAGIQVTGFDPSESMLLIAQERAREESLSIPFVRELPAHSRFDAAILMFAVVNYLQGKDDVRNTLRRLQEVISPRGIIIIETWNAAAVPFLSEPRREKTIHAESVEWIRRTECAVDWKNQVSDIHFTLAPAIPSGETFSEHHRMNYYTYREFTEMFAETGFELCGFFPTFESREVSLDDFSVLYVARRK